MTDATVSQIQMLLEKNARRARVAIENFQTSVANDIMYALSWGDKGFKAAADLYVADKVLAFIDRFNCQEVIDIKHHVTQELLAKAGSNSQSTEQCENLLNRAIVKSYADLAEELLYI